MIRRLSLKIIILNFCLMFVYIAWVPSATAAFKYLSEGMPAPSVTGVDIVSNEKVSTDSWSGDNMIIVAFWATWSQRSIDELHDLKEMAEKYSDVPVKFIAVNVDGQVLTASQKVRIADMVKEMELPFPAIIDDGLTIFYSYGVIAVPSTAIIDTKGVLRYGPAGYSLTTHDLIIDSIEVLTGIKEPTKETVVATGYVPANKASRYYQMALNQVNRRQYKRALGNLEQAQSADLKFAAPHLLRGEVYLALDSLNGARVEFASAVDLDSSLVQAWTGLGTAFLRLNELDSAYAILSTAIKMDETYTPAALNFGLCMAEMGNIDEAIDSVLKARELNRGDAAIHYNLGMLYVKQGDQASAVEAYKSALELIYPAR